MFVALLGLVAATAMAKFQTATLDIPIPGVQANGQPDFVNTGMAVLKAKIDVDTLAVTGKISKGKTPNASGAAADLEYNTQLLAEGFTADCLTMLACKAPAKKTPTQSTAKGTLAGQFVPNP